MIKNSGTMDYEEKTQNKGGSISEPHKLYDLIYTDPAWSYNKKIGQGIADDQYDTMDLEEIKSLPINNMLKDDAVVYMWAVFPMLKEAFEVIEAWGLEYVTVGFNWIKLNDNGSAFFGIGHHTKSNGEICLLLRKGKGLQVKDNTISQVILNKKDTHSKKPSVCYSYLERLYPNTDKIEMFARHKREGWDTWGNQVPKEEQKILQLKGQ